MPSLDVPVSWGTLALTEDGSQEKVKDMGGGGEVAHCRKGWIRGHVQSSRQSI